MKINFNKFCMEHALIFTLFITLCACSSDSDDSDEVIEDPEGTEIVDVYVNPETRVYFYRDCALHFTGTSFWYNPSYSKRIDFNNIGNVSGLGAIKKLPDRFGPGPEVVRPGCGVVARCAMEWDGRWNEQTQEWYTWKYARIYVIDYIKSDAGEIIGVKIKYQTNWDVDKL